MPQRIPLIRPWRKSIPSLVNFWSAPDATLLMHDCLVVVTTDLTLDPASCQGNLGPANHGIKGAMVVFVITEGDLSKCATYS